MSKPVALVIEDDPEIAKIFALSLKNEFEIEMLADGTSALARLTQFVPALIILDLHLPEVSGMDILEWIQSDARLSDTKIVICTADALRAEALHNKADLVLLKPVSPAQLRELASRMITSKAHG